MDQKELLSWNKVLEQFQVDNSGLCELCDKGLPVYDANRNRIYATSQCTGHIVEQPHIVWGKILFDFDEEVLEFEKEVYESNFLYCRIFKETGDFITIRRDCARTLYDEKLYRILMTTEFEKQPTFDFFNKILESAKDNTFLPSAITKLNKYPALRFEEKFPFQDNERAMSMKSIVYNPAKNKTKDIVFTIPYRIIKQKAGAFAEKQIIFRLNVKQRNSLNGDKKDKINHKHMCTAICEVNSESKFSFSENKHAKMDSDTFWKKIADNSITLKTLGMRPLDIFVNDDWFVAPSLENIPIMLDWIAWNNLETADGYIKNFNFAYLHAGILTCAPSKYDPPQNSGANSKIYEFNKLLSPISYKNPLYLDEVIKNDTAQFFFIKDDLKASGCTEKNIYTIDELKTKLIEEWTKFQQPSKNKKDQDAILVVIEKLRTGCSNQDIFPNLFPSEVKERGAIDTYIKRKLDRACTITKNKLPLLPKGKKEWDQFKSDPKQYYQKVADFWELTLI